MKMVLIGHRGTGKSQLLKRLKEYFHPDSPDTQFFDLDQEIANRQGKPIGQVFQESGEPLFRQLEARMFQELTQDCRSWIISLGAGFPLQELPKDVERMWVRRVTDSLGRIFLDRPRLNPEVSALEEFLERLPLREERYRQQATDQYLMPEGIHEANEIEKKIFKRQFENLGGYYTLLPAHFKNLERLQEKIRKFDVERFELRDDLLSLSQIQTVTGLLPPDRVLISLRTPDTHPWLREFIKTSVLWDWAAELGICPFGVPPVISIHHIESSILQSEVELSRHLSVFPIESHIKLSPVVSDFGTLKQLLQWQRSNPQLRSLLPRGSVGSDPGRWTWVRLWLKDRQKINFFRTDEGSASDQPTISQWMATENRPEKFAAVLGSPVFHSQSPVRHQEFFQKKKMPFFFIECAVEEWSEALPLLQSLGLEAAAVTSPLKLKAYQWAEEKSKTARELRSANTLLFQDGVWTCHNTDLDGFRKLLSFSSAQPSSTAVWGGGGTLPVILKACPQVVCFSGRTGEVKIEASQDEAATRLQMLEMKLEGPKTLIWAANPEASFPPDNWRPELILDLNYREDSLAREYALQVRAVYVSGLVMFEEQAQSQQQFWSR